MVALIDTLEPTRIYEFAGGGRVEEYHKGRIMAFVTSEMTREHAEAFYNEAEKVFRNWVFLRKTIRIVVDASAGETTPTFRQKMMQLNAVATSLPLSSRTAFLVQPDHTKDLQLFANLTGSGTDHRLSVFTDRAEAIEWVMKDFEL